MEEMIVFNPWAPDWVRQAFQPIINAGARVIELSESEAEELYAIVIADEERGVAEADGGQEWAPIVVPIAIRIASHAGARSAAGFIGKSAAAGAAAQGGVDAWNWMKGKF